MKKIFLLLSLFSIPSLLISQVLWDDFEQTRVGYYDFVHGGMTARYANPDISSPVNNSSTCAQYVRNSGELWDVLVILGNGPLNDVSDYVSGIKTMSVDVYSPAAGIPVQITLEDSSLAGPANYPTGRHSVYLGATTVANAWETVVLAFDSRPDPTASDVGLSSVILLFNGGTQTGDTYYFDNLYGPEFNNQCEGITSNPTSNLADWDCGWNLSMCPSATACASFDYMSGWLNQGYNPETNTINNSKYSGEYTRNPDANGEDVFIAYPQGGAFDLGLYPFFNMKVYGPPTSLYASFQNNGTEVLGFTQNIWQNNTWQQMNFDLTSVSSGGMAIERVVFFFDQGLVNWDTYYIDDIGLSASPVSITEAFVGFYLNVFPSPASSQSTINFGLDKNSFVKIEVLDLQGRVVSKIVDERLSASSYAYRLNDDLATGLYLIRSIVDNSVFTHKITVNK
mgnify:CR=1 FL=1